MNSMIVFTHIPKTGGMSVCQDAKRLFPNGGYLRVQTKPETRRVPDQFSHEGRKRVRFLAGHFKRKNRFVNMFSQRPLYFGTVRDPVARAVSFVGYFDKKGGPYAGLGLNKSIEMMLKDEHLFTKNGQCEWLTGAYRFDERLIDHNYWLLLPTQSLGKFTNLLREALGFPLRKETPHINRSSVTGGLDSDLERELRARSEGDARLYEWVVRREKDAIEQAKIDLAQLVREDVSARSLIFEM